MAVIKALRHQSRQLPRFARFFMFQSNPTPPQDPGHPRLEGAETVQGQPSVGECGGDEGEAKGEQARL